MYKKAKEIAIQLNKLSYLIGMAVCYFLGAENWLMVGISLILYFVTDDIGSRLYFWAWEHLTKKEEK